jgi:hypothetical protein
LQDSEFVAIVRSEGFSITRFSLLLTTCEAWVFADWNLAARPGSLFWKSEKINPLRSKDLENDMALVSEG